MLQTKWQVRLVLMIFMAIAIGGGCQKAPYEGNVVRFSLEVDAEAFLLGRATHPPAPRFLEMLAAARSHRRENGGDLLGSFRVVTEATGEPFQLQQWFPSYARFTSSDAAWADLEGAWAEALDSTQSVLVGRLGHDPRHAAVVSPLEGKGRFEVQVHVPAQHEGIYPLLRQRGIFGVYSTWHNEDAWSWMFSANRSMQEQGLSIGRLDSILSVGSHMEVGGHEFGIAENAVIGHVRMADTSRVFPYFRQPAFLGALPPDLVLMWDALPNKDAYQLNVIRTPDGRAPIKNKHVSKTALQEDQNGVPCVWVQLNEGGAEIWARMTQHLLNKQVAITIDNVVYSLPRITTYTNGGQFCFGLSNLSEYDLGCYAAMIETGPLPAPVRILGER